MRALKTEVHKAIFRVGALLPLTLWPPMIWIASQDTYSLGRHSAMPLHAVGNQVFLLCHIFGLLGLIMVLAGKADPEIKAMLTVFLVINFIVQFQYILSNAAAYA